MVSPMISRRTASGLRGFTIIELVVVMAVLGLLLSLAVPRYLQSLERGKVQAQEYNMAQIRKAIDQHYADRAAYPDSLQTLVERRYLRAVPVNPRSGVADWVLVSPPAGQAGQVYDVRVPDAPAEPPAEASDAR